MKDRRDHFRYFKMYKKIYFELNFLLKRIEQLLECKRAIL